MDADGMGLLIYVTKVTKYLVYCLWEGVVVCVALDISQTE